MKKMTHLLKVWAIRNGVFFVASFIQFYHITHYIYKNATRRSINLFLNRAEPTQVSFYSFLQAPSDFLTFILCFVANPTAREPAKYRTETRIFFFDRRAPEDHTPSAPALLPLYLLSCLHGGCNASKGWDQDLPAALLACSSKDQLM